MSRFTPIATITIDGQSLTAPEAALLRVEVTLGLGPAHDRCVLELHALAPTVPAAGGTVAVALGFDDDAQDVFTGTVVTVARRPTGAVVECFAPSWQLSRRRAAQAWVGQGAAQIVNDLLSDAGVTAGTVGPDLDLGIFHADDRRSRWAHLLRLARLSGCEVASAADGSLHVRPPASGPAGAGSEAGADHWFLPLASPAGETPERDAWVPGAIRDRNAARSVAKAAADAAVRSTVSGDALCWGQAALRPGDLVTLGDLLDGDVDARLLGVTHVLDASGFATWLDFEGVA